MKKLIKQLKEIARKYADREERVYAYMEPMVYHRFGWPRARQRDTRSGLV